MRVLLAPMAASSELRPGRPEHELLREHRGNLELAVIDRAADEGPLQAARAHGLDQLGGGPRAQDEIDLRVCRHEARQHRRQTQRGRQFERTERQATRRFAVIFGGALRLGEQVQDLLGIG